MAVLEARKTDQTTNETIEGGFLQYDLVQTWQVKTDNREDGEFTVLSYSGLPSIGQSLLFGQTLLWCVSRNPTRPDPVNAATDWRVVCVFTNNTGSFERDAQGNPTTDLEQIVPNFSFSFQEVEVDITTARLKSVTKADGTIVAVPPNLKVRGNSGRRGAITNTAGTVKPRSMRSNLKIIKYRFYARDWNNNWDDILNHVNSEAIVFTQSDRDGQRLSQSYGERKLLLNDILKEDIWREGRLWFRVTFVLLYNRLTWRHFEPDAGTERRIFVGQYKSDGTTMDQTYIDNEGLGPFQTITTTTEEGAIATVGGEVKFNGYGAEIPRSRPGGAYDTDETFTVNFDIYEEADIGAAMGL